MKTVLTIAGSDCSGGAGIQADIKTITVHNVYAMSAITSLTDQNTRGVFDVYDVSPEFLNSQLESIFSDIYPDAVKIGMISRMDLLEVIIKQLKKYKATNIVLDPVMISTSGRRLLEECAEEKFVKELMPLASIITPNIPEAEHLSGINIESKASMVEAAKKLSYQGIAVLIKGGHCQGNADDLLYLDDKYMWFEGTRIKNSNTHGTGCTLSSAIASNLAMGKDICESVSLAKEYITGAIEAGLNLGSGNGPLNHMYKL